MNVEILNTLDDSATKLFGIAGILNIAVTSDLVAGQPEQEAMLAFIAKSVRDVADGLFKLTTLED